MNSKSHSHSNDNDKHNHVLENIQNEFMVEKENSPTRHSHRNDSQFKHQSGTCDSLDKNEKSLKKMVTSKKSVRRSIFQPKQKDGKNESLVENNQSKTTSVSSVSQLKQQEERENLLNISNENNSNISKVPRKSVTSKKEIDKTINLSHLKNSNVELNITSKNLSNIATVNNTTSSSHNSLSNTKHDLASSSNHSLRDRSLLMTPETLRKQRQFPVQFKLLKCETASSKKSAARTTKDSQNKKNISPNKSVERKATKHQDHSNNSSHEKNQTKASISTSPVCILSNTSPHKQQVESNRSFNLSTQKNSGSLKMSRKRAASKKEIDETTKMTYLNNTNVEPIILSQKRPNNANNNDSSSAKLHLSDNRTLETRSSRNRSMRDRTSLKAPVDKRQYPAKNSGSLKTSRKRAASKKEIDETTKMTGLNNTNVEPIILSKKRPNNANHNDSSSAKRHLSDNRILDTGSSGNHSLRGRTSLKAPVDKRQYPAKWFFSQKRNSSSNKILNESTKTSLKKRKRDVSSEQITTSTKATNRSDLQEPDNSHSKKLRIISLDSTVNESVTIPTAKSAIDNDVNDTIVTSQKSFQPKKRNIISQLKQVEKEASQNVRIRNNPERKTISLWREEGQTYKGSEVGPADVILDCFMNLENQLNESTEEPIERKLISKVFKNMKNCLRSMAVKEQHIKDLQKKIRQKKSDCAKRNKELEKLEEERMQLDFKVSHCRPDENKLDKINHWIKLYTELTTSIE